MMRATASDGDCASELQQQAQRTEIQAAAKANAEKFSRFVVPDWRLTKPEPAFAILGDATNIEAGLGVKETVVDVVYTATFNGDHSAPLPEPKIGVEGMDGEEVLRHDKWKIKHEAAREQEKIYLGADHCLVITTATVPRFPHRPSPVLAVPPGGYDDR